MKAISRKLWGLILAALLAAGPVPACGPQFPNNFLESGETTLFAAPQAEFYAALDRIKLPPPRFHASVPTNGVYGYAAQTTATDLADLRAALRLAKVPTREKDALLKAHAAEREKLDKYSEESTEWHESNQWGWTDGEFKLLRKPTPPKFPAVQVVPGRHATSPDRRSPRRNEPSVPLLIHEWWTSITRSSGPGSGLSIS